MGYWIYLSEAVSSTSFSRSQKTERPHTRVPFVNTLESSVIMIIIFNQNVAEDRLSYNFIVFDSLQLKVFILLDKERSKRRFVKERRWISGYLSKAQPNLSFCLVLSLKSWTQEAMKSRTIIELHLKRCKKVSKLCFFAIVINCSAHIIQINKQTVIQHE